MKTKVIHLMLVALTLGLIGFVPVQAQTHDHSSGDAHGHGEERSVPVTIWTDRFEVFAEHPLPVAGQPAAFVTHITNLNGFAPRRNGAVTFVLEQGSQRIKHREPSPQRDGIYIPELIFPQAGTWSVVLQIPVDDQTYDVRFPPIQVYKTQAQADKAPDPAEPEGFGFLKEQQWVMPFEVERVQEQIQDGLRCIIAPDTALVYDNGGASVFVQVSGETFVRRHVTVRDMARNAVSISTGLDRKDHLVTKGAASLVLASGMGSGSESHDAHVQGLTPTPAQMQRFDIGVETAVHGGLQAWLPVPGEIRINQARMAHIVSRVGGVVREVRAHLGDQVRAGQVLAVIESRALADAKAEYLAAQAYEDLTAASFKREQTLFSQQVSAEQDYLKARQTHIEAGIRHRTARHKLLSLGLTGEDLTHLADTPEASFTTYHLVAPFNGTLIEKHLVLGEVVDPSVEVLVIADLSTVWVDLAVNQEDLIAVALGQPVRITVGHGGQETMGRIDYIDPVVDKDARAGIARIVLDNPEGRYRAGVFVNARIQTGLANKAVILPAESIQNVGDQPSVFVRSGEGFVLRPVSLGVTSATGVEILSGVEAGEEVVIRNAFHLKAELEKQAGGEVSGHGHAH